ncbi:MAG TPA: hypothetical protein PLF42_09745 [Anaerolineales bacterium]|nr:hypothetical protein [Anaerolineales bacterium]
MVPKKKEVQTKSEREAAPGSGGEGESIGLFLAWMFLYWVFTLLLAASLALAV